MKQALDELLVMAEARTEQGHDAMEDKAEQSAAYWYGMAEGLRDAHRYLWPEFLHSALVAHQQDSRHTATIWYTDRTINH